MGLKIKRRGKPEAAKAAWKPGPRNATLHTRNVPKLYGRRSSNGSEILNGRKKHGEQ